MPENTNSLLALELMSAILVHPAIEDCYVLQRDTDSGRELVAYIVANQRVSEDEITSALVLETPGRPTPDQYVPIATLPLTSSGEVDIPALRAIALLNTDLLAIAEEQVQDLPGIGQVAFVIEEDPAPLPLLHLSDLMPDWKRSGSTRREPPASPLGTRPSAAAHGGAAICTGEPLQRSIPQNLPTVLQLAVSGFGSQGIVYIQEDEREIFQSYSDLMADSEKILHSLRTLGAQPQDRFIFQFRRNQDFIPAFWACMLGGFVPVPISIAPTYEQENATISKLHNAWQMLGKPRILTDEGLSQSLQGLAGHFGFDDLQVSVIEHLRKAERDHNWHPSQPDDLALLLFTSGSTGKPKAVRQSHGALLNRSAATSQRTKLSDADVFLNWMPLDHVGGIVMYHLPGIYLGARQVHAPTQVVLQAPLKWLDLIDKHRVTTTWAPNFAYGLVNTHADEIAKRKWDLSKLVFILNAGEAIVARTARRFLELLIPHGLPSTAMRPSWGMSETCSAVTYSDRFTLEQTSDSDLFVEVGAPAPEFSMRIVDAEEALLEEGAIGRLQVKGPSVTRGYDQNPTANRDSFTPDGWFTTGDLGKIDDGQLTITGRQKDVIIVNGVNFYSHELEAVVEEVVGVDVSFTAVCAVREEGTDTDSIAVFFCPISDGDTQLAGTIREIRGRLVRNAGVNPTYMVPLVKRQIPKTEIGKIQRAQLQQRLADGEFDEVLKRVDILTESANTIPDWFFEKVWQRRNLTQIRAEDHSTGWLVFCDRSGLGGEVCARLQMREPAVQVTAGNAFTRSTKSHFTIDPSNPEHYRQLFAELASEGRSVSRVLHLWTYGFKESGVKAADDGAMQLLHLTRELNATVGVGEIDLYVVSSNSQFLTAGDVSSYENAALPVILKTASAEEPRLRCRHIDLAPGDALANVNLLIEEIDAVAFDSEVAYRDGARYVPRLRRSACPAAEAAGVEFVKAGTYLLTGGLGGIGVEIARFLLTRYQARVLLIGRKTLSDSTSIGAQTLESLKALGDVRYAAVDVCDMDALEETVAAAERAWGSPLDAILHMAAVYHDGPLAKETSETLTEAFHAKVRGAWALQQLLESRRKTLFIGFSSVLSFFPGALVGAYAAANRILENLMLSWRTRGFNTYTIAWSSWRDIGMSKGQTAREALRAKGIREMLAEQAWHSMVLGLRRGHSLLFVGLDPGNATIRKVTTGEPCGLRRLSAYFLISNKSTRSELRQVQLSDRFGTAIQFRCYPIDEIPRTTSGTIDREALIASVRRGSAAPYAEPATDVERQICAVWQDVLNAPHMGVEDNFFMLGGHSLLATRVMSRLRSSLGIDIPLRNLFDAPTVRGLASYIEKVVQSRSNDTVTIRQVESRDQLPLSFTQQRLWFLDQLQPGGNVYNVPLVFRVRGVLDIDVLGQSLNAVVTRHESLRTTFHVTAEQPIQRIRERAGVTLLTVKIRDCAVPTEQEALRLIGEEVRRPFDLTRDVLLRALVLRVQNDDFFLALTIHHIAADGWSLDILFCELSSYYNAFLEGQLLELEPLQIQFADYAAWQRGYLDGAVLDEQLDYWRNQLEGAPPQLRLPSDLPRPATQSFRGALYGFTLPRELAAAVAEICRTEEVTPFIVLLTVLQILLRQYSGQNDISVGSPIANRTNLETEGLIGFFANTLVLRTVFSRDPSFKEMLAKARETVLGAYAHQHMPFEGLVEILKPPRAAYNPLFQVNFRVVTMPPATLRFGDTVAERVPFDPGTARFDLSLELLIAPDRFEGYFEYSTDLFHPATIHRLHSDLENILRALSKQPDVPLSLLGLGRFGGASSNSHKTAIRRRAAKSSGALS